MGIKRRYVEQMNRQNHQNRQATTTVKVAEIRVSKPRLPKQQFEAVQVLRDIVHATFVKGFQADWSPYGTTKNPKVFFENKEHLESLAQNGRAMSIIQHAPLSREHYFRAIDVLRNGLEPEAEPDDRRDWYNRLVLDQNFDTWASRVHPPEPRVRKKTRDNKKEAREDGLSRVYELLAQVSK